MSADPVKIGFEVRFGDNFSLDTRAYELRRAGRVLKLERIPMELLILLIEEQGQLVSRDHIIQRIWGKDVFLDTDNSINAAVRKIRQVLKDDPEQPRFVQTITGRGYRFIAAIASVNPPPTFEVAKVPAQNAENLAGKKVSHYRILQVLGGGGMGIVYKAEDLKLGRRVAIKFLPAEMASDLTAFGRMEREARASSALEHPNICPIYELGEHDGQPFIVMQLLEGQTLREWIEHGSHESTPARVKQLLEIAIQVADGLEAAHQKGIIHRDIKPANIFITSRGEAKILDFGVAKFMGLAEPSDGAPDGEDSAAIPSDPSLTRTGISVGTPSYLSPEQVRCEKLDVRTDIFSFGLVLYEMATGQRAFTGNSAAVIRDAVLHMPEVPVRQLNPELPVELEVVIARALDKDRDRRHQNAAEIQADLRQVKHSGDSVSRVEQIRIKVKPAAISRKHTITRRLAVVSILVICAGLIAGAFYYRAGRAKRLTEKDTIVLADFSNSTNDPVFDGTLKQGLSIALSQSPFLKILPDSKVRSTLRLMTKPADVALSGDTVSEVCQRSGSKAYVAGAIAALGTEYVVGLQAVNCQIGETLAEEQVTAKSKEEVISALGRAASELRRKLGESISTINKFDVPLREATTGSLDALKEYTLGGQIENQKGAVAAIPHYEKAVALDPFFAKAYSGLATLYFDSGESSLAATYATKAYELRDRGTDLEKVQIDSAYHSFVTGDLQKVAEAYQLWADLRPQSPSPHVNLGFIYTQMGQNEKSLAETLQGLRLGQDGEVYSNTISAYIALNRLNEAKATFAEAESGHFGMPVNHNNLYLIAFIERDRQAMAREAAAVAGQPGIEDASLYFQSCTQAYFGKLKEARELSRSASNSALVADQKETAAEYRADAAMREALFGNTSEAEQEVRNTLDASRGPDLKAVVALTYAFARDQKRAQLLADDLTAKFPENTLVQMNYLPAIRGQIAVNAGNPRRAIELLKPARPYELGQPAQATMINLYPVFVRGEAYLAARDGAAAAAEFQEILNQPGMVLNEPIGVLAHLGLARAYALQGENGKARMASQEFLTLWKDADPDVPILKQALAENGKLN
jgi:eukaryotic-like serine/threonine-protein kinase